MKKLICIYLVLQVLEAGVMCQNALYALNHFCQQKCKTIHIRDAERIEQDYEQVCMTGESSEFTNSKIS